MARLKDKAEEIDEKIRNLNYPVIIIIYANAGGGIVGYKIYQQPSDKIE